MIELIANMVLEATVVCVDNSDFMINGDYKPTRLQAQAEAVNLLAELTAWIVTQHAANITRLLAP